MLTEKELGERLKNIREVQRISQFRLGEMVECGQGHIGKLETGGLRWTGIRRPEVDLCPAQMKIRFERTSEER